MNAVIHQTDPIIALATGQGESAIAVIRLSGQAVIDIVANRFSAKTFAKADGNTLHFGTIRDKQNAILDECLVSLFRAPHSYTKEDSVEISCHGSPYIVQSIIALFLADGVRLAAPGEFTMRAYFNGQLDLSQAEAVADLISSKSAAQHEMAMNQLRGGFSKMIADLRGRLIKFASLIELENDFGEEDVEFANRSELSQTVQQITNTIISLKDSFDYGNAIKEGVPVVIIGKPNAGKSTLLNALLQDDKAIVSSIPGTTRDVIEDTVIIDGLQFRFFDTAGLRETENEIEQIGIERTWDKVSKASIVIFLTEIAEDHQQIITEYKALHLRADQKVLIALNKIDDFHACHSYDVEEAVSTLTDRTPTIAISAKDGKHLDLLRQKLVVLAKADNQNQDSVIVSNIRHRNALAQAQESLLQVKSGLENSVPSDIIAMDIRHAMHHLGEISGEITTDDLLDSIFRDFCIGK